MAQISEFIKPTVPKILVANKIDLEEMREVGREEGEELARKFGVPFLEVSAKEGTNIENIFSVLGRKII